MFTIAIKIAGSIPPKNLRGCASFNPGDTVLDPFAGSGAALRVCQQTDRIKIDIDINLEYIEMVNERLAEEFLGFDRVDKRTKRVPNDLNDADVREEYI